MNSTDEMKPSEMTHKDGSLKNFLEKKNEKGFFKRKPVSFARHNLQTRKMLMLI